MRRVQRLHDIGAGDLIDRLKRQRNFAFVRRQVSPEEAQRVKALNLDGIASQKESRRYYPNKELAAHLLGFVGLDNKGLGGIESAYDSQIRGKEGRFSFTPTLAAARLQPLRAAADYRLDH